MSAYVITSEKEAFGKEMLDGILMWIKDNLEIDQVYDDDWIFGFIAESASAELWKKLVQIVGVNELPEDVFSTAELVKWAESEGYQL